MEALEMNIDASEDDILGSDITVPSEIGGCDFSKAEARDKPVEIDEFYFESDHLALKGNQDYLALLKTLSVLEAQKIQTVKDIDILLEARDKAMADPIAFVEKLQRGEQLKLPGPIKIAELPEIDWTKYDLDETSCVERRPSKRATKQSVLLSNSSIKTEVLMPGTSNAKVERTEGGDVLVRGRIFKNCKPKNFNQPWTIEEQKRLEELLEVFPTEDVEMERWKKIAASLGNRTAVQVQSRVQKYFLKLHKAGLPIPGRLPPQRNKNRYMKSVKRHNRYGKFTNILTGRRSTFLASVLPKVKMDDFEDDSTDGLFSANGFDSSNSTRDSFEDEYLIDQASSCSSSEDEALPADVRASAECKEMRWLMRIRREKEVELRQGTAMHLGYECNRCGAAPILGTRWRCRDCESSGQTVDFCSDCAPADFTVGVHKQSHKLKRIRKATRVNEHQDTDYIANSFNYLDTNYLDKYN